MKNEFSPENYLSNIARDIKPSGIRKFFDVAATMPDVISLGVGEPDFATPWHIRTEAIRALEKGHTFYTSNWGLIELRRCISDYLKETINTQYNPDDEIMVTVGASEAIDLCLRAFVAPGDEVLIPEPSFVCYTPCTQLAGGVPVAVETRQETGFKLLPDVLEKCITPKSKLLILPYPNNPTGGIMTKEDLEKLVPIIKKHNLIVLCDEIYSELTYSGKHFSISSLDGMKERCVVVNGFSKAFAMTGWRLGYACAPKEVMKTMIKIHQFGIMSAPTFSQYAAIDALKNGRSDIEEMKEEYNERRKYLVNALNKMGLDCFEPLGAFYVFPSIKKLNMTSEEFCEKILYSQKLAVVPGNAFGESGEGHIRISYAYSLDNIKSALKRLQAFIDENCK